MVSEKRIARYVRTKFAQLVEMGQATAAQIGVTPTEANRLANQGFIRPVDVERNGEQGRPAVIYRATDKTRKRVRRALAA